MKKYRPSTTGMIIFGMLLSNLFCSQLDPEKIEEKKKNERIKFHSKNVTGKWKIEAKNHVPVYSVENERGSRVIKVSIPFRGSVAPLHYIETIILADSRHKILKQVTFKRGNEKPSATFKIPADNSNGLFIISKCNLHDMWEEKIVFK